MQHESHGVIHDLMLVLAAAANEYAGVSNLLALHGADVSRGRARNPCAELRLRKTKWIVDHGCVSTLQLNHAAEFRERCARCDQLARQLFARFHRRGALTEVEHPRRERHGQVAKIAGSVASQDIEHFLDF